MDLETARKTPFAWPGGYPIYALMDDCEMLCHKCLHEPEVHEGGDRDGWRFEGTEVYWEGPTLTCPHCNEDNIESAYGDPDED